MKLVFAGTPEAALPSLAALLSSHHKVLAVVTRPDAPGRRGRTLLPSPVAQAALAAGLEVLRPRRPKDPEFIERLTELAPDCCPIVAYGALIPQQVIDIPSHGWVNLHFSLLPAWRGAAPVQHAVWNGDPVTGAATFALVPELDAGPVYATLTEPIGPHDTSGDLLQRLAHRGADLLVETLDGIAAGRRPEAQPSEGISLAPKITTEDARIDWNRSATAIDRQIRACTPDPGAWTTFRGERFKIISAAPAEGPTATPGAIEADKRRLSVGCGSGRLELITVQAQGKKPMSGADWARGVHHASTETFGS